MVGVIAVVFGVLSARRGRPSFATTWRQGHAALAAGRYAEAEACFRATLPPARARFGEEHWRTALHANALARALIGQRRLDEAAPFVATALGIFDRWSPMPHPSLLAVLLVAAQLELALGHQAQARALIDRAAPVARGNAALEADLARLTALFAAGDDDRPRADALAGIPFEHLERRDARELAICGLARLRARDFERALRCLTAAHAVAERESPGEFAEAYYRGLLGETQAKAGRDDDALRSLEQAVVDYDAVVGEGHPSTATLLVELAAVRLRLGDLPGVRSACERVLSSRLPSPRGDDPYRAGTVADDPIGPERERARALLARARGAEGR